MLVKVDDILLEVDEILEGLRYLSILALGLG